MAKWVQSATTALAWLMCARVARAADVVDYYHQDGLGSVRATTNQAGQVIERHDYVPFGDEWNPQPAAQPRGFTGKERDAETGLNYFGGRYYGAKTGRFTTIDPVYTWGDNLVDPQRWNRYAYVRNNPLRYVDPDGRKIEFSKENSKAFMDGYRRARKYLADAGLDGPIRIIEEAEDYTLTLCESWWAADHGDFSKTDKFDWLTNQLWWSQFAGLAFENGGLSPAMGLLHEFIHALHWYQDPVTFIQNRTPRGLGCDRAYDSLEEKRTIQMENAAAGKLGEGIRRHHGGVAVYAGDVTEVPAAREGYTKPPNECWWDPPNK